MVISDSHMGSIYELVDYLVFVYKEAKKRGITEVYHIGDISDGYYTNRPEQIYSLKCIGFDAQVDNIIANYPKEEGITTYFILGNHDETHIKNGGANLGIAVSRDRSGYEVPWYRFSTCYAYTKLFDGPSSPSSRWIIICFVLFWTKVYGCSNWW